MDLYSEQVNLLVEDFRVLEANQHNGWRIILLICRWIR